MAKKQLPTIIGLDTYGLELADLKSHLDRKMRFSLSLRELPLEELVPLSPKGRMRTLDLELKQRATAIRAADDFEEFEPRSRKVCWTYDVVSSARAFLQLARSEWIGSLAILSIIGLRKRRRARPTLEWYAVRAKVAIEIEGQTSGLQQVEDRIVLVKAYSFEDAEARLEKEWAEYASPYLNPAGELVRWQMQEIVDVFQTLFDKIDPKGTEVWSALSQRRMRPEYVWDGQLSDDRARDRGGSKNGKGKS